MEAAEEAFAEAEGYLLDLIDELSPSTSTHSQSQIINNPMPHYRRLQPLPMKHFSGNYAEWREFRDIFTSMVTEDRDLKDVDRLQYLKLALEGEAAKAVSNIAITNENFKRAWKVLEEKYENLRALVTTHIAEFYSIKPAANESAKELNRILNGAQQALDALESLGRVTDWEDYIVYHLAVRLDSNSRRDWEISVGEGNEPPSLQQFKGFMRARIRALESILPQKSNQQPAAPSKRASCNTVTKEGDSSGKGQEEKPQNKCAFCAKDHYISSCAEFKATDIESRNSFVASHSLCYNCLGHHAIRECKSKKTCQTCKKRHHTLLHRAKVSSAAPTSSLSCSTANASPATSANPSSGTEPQGTSTPNTKLTTHFVRIIDDNAPALLATARVFLHSESGVISSVRALVDQGSQGSLISERLVQRLHLQRNSSHCHVYGAGQDTPSLAKGFVSLTMQSRTQPKYRCSFKAAVLPRLTSYTPSMIASEKSWLHLTGLPLADPEFASADRIDLLLGAEIYGEILEPGLRKGPSGTPIAQSTKLGWIVSGSAPSLSPEVGNAITSHHCSINSDLLDLVRRFWEQEEMQGSCTISKEDEECDNHYSRTYQRDADGRYIVRLPFKADQTMKLGDSRPAAAAALYRMEQRFKKQPDLQKRYCVFLGEYAELGHMIRGPEIPTNDPSDQFYLPHHGVIRESSVTTKLRVVFNGSQKTDSGNSLNDVLMTGRNLLPELRDIILRWRLHRIVFAADVEKMYRQIRVHADDYRFQQILWRASPQEPLSMYQLSTVTYGLNCAPFLANRTIRQLGQDERSRFPVAASIIDQDVYMDDIISGDDDIEGARVKQRQLIGLFAAGGFPLRKWNANNRLLLDHLPADCVAPSATLSWQGEAPCQLLGISWSPEKDSFSFAIKTEPMQKITKRSVLSKSSQLFDPLGWLAPVTISAKIFLQSLWLLNTGWDEALPETEEASWNRFYSELPTLSGLLIPRWIHHQKANRSIELHGFADASQRAYAAVVYVRVVTNEGAVTISLLTAKTKVAPLKPVTLPRLELCAAQLLAKLVGCIRRAWRFPEIPVYLYTDAKIVLDWLRGHPSRWPTYVANRVSEIQRSLPGVPWRHVKSAENPADCASRGMPASQLSAFRLWWEGPDFLRESPGSWPSEENTSEDAEALPRAAHAAAVKSADPFPLLERYSSLKKLTKVTAWILRYLHNLKTKADRLNRVTPPPLVPDEIEEAQLHLIRMVQRQAFPDIIEGLRNGTLNMKKHELKKLTPFLDANDCLRVGGRLKHSLLNVDSKHPLILPRHSELTKLLIVGCHERTLHGGTQLTLATLRQKYWILCGRSAVKTIINRCLKCFRFRAKASQQIMGQLPYDRVTPTPRAFVHVGVDYAGPIYTRTTKGRGHKATKSYVCVFICLATRAVHLELVSDYSSQAFIAAFRRFTSRRGTCATMRSDCGTTFVGADAELRHLFAQASAFSEKIAEQIVEDGTKWIFNPPGAPHFGGIWEAAVKSTKHHLKRVIGEATLTFEEMTTLLAQIEACLNSRPLQALSDDPSDLDPLTPGHFLIGGPLNAVPSPPLDDIATPRLARWQQIQKMTEHFWSRWSEEYLQSLQPKSKWTKDQPSIQLNDLVLLRAESLPPTKWSLGRVSQLHPGKDGKVRVATIRTASSTLQRPIVKLSPLPK